MTHDLIQHDQSQRELALNPTKSFIVQAPAGSGKTELLIQRLLTLLGLVKSPEEILAITFTKKAANEMRERVMKALQDTTPHPPDSPHARKTWRLAKCVLERDKKFHWNLLKNPNQLRIQTIDSLCAYLTKQLPLLSHFGSQPGIATHPDFLYREATQEVLLHIEENFQWSNALAQLLLHLDNDLNKLQDLLINLLAKREQWLAYIQLNTHNDIIRQELEHHLTLVITDRLKRITECFPKEMVAELMAIARFAADNLIHSQPNSEIIGCHQLYELPSVTASDKQTWLGIAKLLLTKTFSWRKRVDADIGFPPLASVKNLQAKALHSEYRQRFSQLIASLTQHENLRLALADSMFLPDASYQDQQWEILTALLQVLKVVTAQLRVTFKAHGQIDFIENAQAALNALGDNEHPTDLALVLDYQIRHILVDEFQDTSFIQYQLLEKLIYGWENNDGRTLFVVGDPMQSIYRFREAEVGLFIRMCKYGIGHIPLTPITLSVNFRSTPTIVDWNNQHFSTIFPAVNDMTTGAVTYTPSIAHPKPGEKNVVSIAEIRGFLDGAPDTQATHIANVIMTIKENHPQEKIAILVRSRTHLTALIPALKKAAIAYRAVDIDSLASRQHIQDLLSLTCALLHPADRIAWLAILRAPWCGLTLTDLHIIAGQQPFASIYELLENKILYQQLSVDGQCRIERIFPILKAQIANRERCSLRYWVESTWLSLGGPACLKSHDDIADTNEFFESLDELSQHNPFVNLEKLKEKINQLYASSQQEDSVQIMTIHTAKGLEFDTVIIPHLERKSAIDDKPLLQWMEQPLPNDKIAILLAPIHATGDSKNNIYEYIHRQQKIKSDYETDRLFYVATTRASKRLYLFFDIEKNQQDNFKIEGSSFLKKIWPLIEKRMEELIIPADNDNVLNKSQPIKYMQRLSESWQNPLDVSSQLILPAYHKQQNGFQLNNAGAKHIGIVAHRLLQHLANKGTSSWQKLTYEEQYRYLSTQLKQTGLINSAIESAVKTIYNMIKNMLHDPRGQWILKSHQAAKAELALTTTIDDTIENLVIDRTFIDENNIRWIIDYKTTAFSQADMALFLTTEKEKHIKQMNKYYEAFKAIETRPIRLGLYFPALPAWLDWE